MHKIGIICAGDRELAPFLPHITDDTLTKKAMLTFHEGTIHGVRVVALYCGVCKTNAALATQILIDTYRVDIIINAGTAGGMDEALDIFDTIIATEVAHHDVAEGILTEFHPWLSSVFMPSDEHVLLLARHAIDRIHPEHGVIFGRMITGEAFIDDDGRDEINAAFAPLCVDMETASIAQVCYVNQIPFIAIRTLTDTGAHSGAEHFDRNCAEASRIAKEIVLALLDEIMA